jgi:nicotinate-nucleotide adenylyltransferase
MSRIGIMGGTFNPIHFAHLILAESSYEELKLDKVLFMPSKKPPHKLNENIVSDSHRVRMIQLAIQDNPHFEVSCMELEREGITYTADTLRELNANYPEDEFYFIMGTDSLYQIEDWWKPKQIFNLTNIVVAVRDHTTNQKLSGQVDHLTEQFGARIHLLNTPNMDISSKMLRQCLSNCKSIRYYVPDAVEQYIRAQNLYMEP